MLEFTEITLFNSIPILHRKYSTNNKKVKRISEKSITLIESDCKAIIPFIYINIGNSIGIRLNQMSPNITVLFMPLKEQIIGHLLGDGSINYAKTSVNP
jgi:hypothetical protein